MKEPKPLKIKKSRQKQTYKSFNRKKERNIKSIALKRYYVLIAIILLGMSILIIDLTYIQLFQNVYYQLS